MQTDLILPRQARWSLFFAHFNFSITYRPSSKNTKPDALSWQFSNSNQHNTETSILPDSCVLGALSWIIERDVKEAQRLEPDPGTGPMGKMFVPSSIIKKVLDWVHNNKLTCHPGVSQMTVLLRYSSGGQP